MARKRILKLILTTIISAQILGSTFFEAKAIDVQNYSNSIISNFYNKGDITATYSNILQTIGGKSYGKLKTDLFPEDNSIPDLIPGVNLPMEDPMTTAKVLTTTLLGEIPLVGGIISNFAGLFIPDSLNEDLDATEIWGRIEGEVEKMIGNEISKNEFERIRRELEGLYNNVKPYTESVNNLIQNPYNDDTKILKQEVWEKLETCLGNIAGRIPQFQMKDRQVLLLPYFIQAANLHLAILRDSAVNGMSLDHSRAFVVDYEKLLKEKTKEYSDYVFAVYKKGVQETRERAQKEAEDLDTSLLDHPYVPIYDPHGLFVLAERRLTDEELEVIKREKNLMTKEEYVDIMIKLYDFHMQKLIGGYTYIWSYMDSSVYGPKVNIPRPTDSVSATVKNATANILNFNKVAHSEGAEVIEDKLLGQNIVNPSRDGYKVATTVNPLIHNDSNVRYKVSGSHGTINLYINGNLVDTVNVDNLNSTNGISGMTGYYVDVNGGKIPDSAFSAGGPTEVEIRGTGDLSIADIQLLPIDPLLTPVTLTDEPLYLNTEKLVVGTNNVTQTGSTLDFAKGGDVVYSLLTTNEKDVDVELSYIPRNSKDTKVTIENLTNGSKVETTLFAARSKHVAGKLKIAKGKNALRITADNDIAINGFGLLKQTSTPEEETAFANDLIFDGSYKDLSILGASIAEIKNKTIAFPTERTASVKFTNINIPTSGKYEVYLDYSTPSDAPRFAAEVYSEGSRSTGIFKAPKTDNQIVKNVKVGELTLQNGNRAFTITNQFVSNIYKVRLHKVE